MLFNPSKNDVTLTEFDGVVVKVSFADRNIVSLIYKVWNTSGGTQLVPKTLLTQIEVV